jgi:CheY-like chemotaxis protein
MSEKKIVLFVDDRPENLFGFIDAIKDNGYQPEWVESLDEAVLFLKEKEQEIIGVVIDLLIPGLSEIDNYQKYYKVTINQGQSLGLYMREHYTDIPYFYFSSVIKSYSRPDSLTEQEPVESKYTMNSEHFYEYCKKHFGVK